jgi:long-subunit fatty acid transport protein
MVSMSLPDILQAGVRVEVTPRIDVEGAVRWVHYGSRAQLDVSLQGGDLGLLATSRAAAVPPEFRLDRGLQDAWGLETSARFQVSGPLRLSPSLFFETSAIESSAVSAAAIDGPKVDLALTGEWRPVRHLVVGAHVGGTAYVLGDVHSRYDSRAEAACVDAHYALEACGQSLNGSALPTASGHYTLFVVHLGASIGLEL